MGKLAFNAVRKHMNKRSYWKIRKKVLLAIFRLKKMAYRGAGYIELYSEGKGIIFIMGKSAIKGILKSIIIAMIMLWLDGIIIKKSFLPAVNINILVQVVIGGIGVAGIVLGLFCANVASIFSTRYANAPKNIADAFQNDRLTQKCITIIVDYIIFGFVVLLIMMLKYEISWITVLVTILWSIIVVISYSTAGKRTYHLADVYRVATDAYQIIIRITTKSLKNKLFSMDVNFQNHFQRYAEKQINLLKSIQMYGASTNNADNSAMSEFMINNLLIIELYWEGKKEIVKNSIWFRDLPKYQRWHLTSETETSLALQTGTPLRVKGERNYWWFEEEIISINRSCLLTLFEQQDYLSLYSYLRMLEKMCKTAIECKETVLFVQHIDWLKNAIENHIKNDNANSKNNNAFSGVVEAISLLYLNLINESIKIYREFNLDQIVAEVINAIDLGDDFERSIIINSRDDVEFFKKIIIEIRVEGKRITPDWVIKQQVAKEEYVYFNSLIDIVNEGMDHAFSLGKLFAEIGLNYEACIILTRFYEYESKITRFIELARYREKEFKSLHIEKELKWDNFRLNNLVDTISEWKEIVPTFLSKCASQFALEKWQNSEEYPDFLGESYNHICEDAVNAITVNDSRQFEVDFRNLSMLMLLYQEYIRSDFLKKNNLYRIEYAYYTFTSPIVEWAQIGGLAILWGEFFSKEEWKNHVKKGADLILLEKGEVTDLAGKLIEYIQHRDRFMLGIGNRDVLETQWQQSVENRIKESGICQSQYTMFERRLKTESELLNAFCPDFIEMGFFNDPSEVFWVLCVNPLLDNEKKFHTKYSWEDKMNEKDIKRSDVDQ